MMKENEITPTPSATTSKKHSVSPHGSEETNYGLRYKRTAFYLALFLGTFGVHRFYLRQNGKGALHVIFSWTLIPTLISLGDVLYFLFITQEKFDLRYNNGKASAAQRCASCNKPLRIMNKPTFGQGKLEDGKEICYRCFTHGEMTKLKQEWQDFKSSLPENPRYSSSHSTAKPMDFSPPKDQEVTLEYHQLLAELSLALQQIKEKLQNSKVIEDYFAAAGKKGAEKDRYIEHVILYDVVKIFRKLVKGNLAFSRLKTTGLVMVCQPFLSFMRENLTLQDYKTFQNAFQKNLYLDLAQELCQLDSDENPLQLDVQEKDGETVISQNRLKNTLAFPAFLKISNSDFFDEYATLLYRFACIIAKADGSINTFEDRELKKIHQLIHQPLPQKENTALIRSESKATETLGDVLGELHALVGLDEVKQEISTLINFIKIQKERERKGLKTSPTSYHLVFTGNPGTGKTTVARIVARIYKHLGILSEGHLVETDRSGLVAEYAGQTAVKVNATVNTALNGVLFIDEAYALVGENKDDFGKEAVATLIKRIEDDRDKLVVILAGYTQEMQDFIATNPGFKSRFNRYINFPDYAPAELSSIFERMCTKLDYRLNTEAKAKLQEVLEEAYLHRDQSFGNGRMVRNLFEKTIENQANRIAKETLLTHDLLTMISAEDIE